MGEGVQIIKTVSDGKKQTLVLDKDKLDSVLRKADIAEKNVIVLSIAGTFRKGKSFFLSFIVKYLEYLERTGKSNGWLNRADTLKKAFVSKGGKAPVTNGIYIYSKVFVVKQDKGEKVAVVLMDTQGLFDNDSETKLSTTIFALSTMISSMQMVNNSQQLNTADMGQLAFFTGYTNVVMAGKRSQSLLFLIRDWQNIGDHTLGLEGGKSYIADFLKTDPEKNAKETLKESFENMECCLLPYPGDAVSTDRYPDGSAFDGKLTGVSTSFLDAIRLAIPEILTKSRVKTIGEKRITCGELADYIETYTKAIKSEEGKLPDQHSLYQATLKTFSDNVVSKTVGHYTDKMQEKTIGGYVRGIEECHKDCEKQAMDLFEKSGHFGTKEDKKTMDERLKEELKASYEVFKNYNVKVEAAICGAIGGAVTFGATAGTAGLLPASSVLSSAVTSEAVLQGLVVAAGSALNGFTLAKGTSPISSAAIEAIRNYLAKSRSAGESESEDECTRL